MCGILWLDCKGGTSAVKPLLKRYRKQEHRGKTGYGYITVNAEGYVGEVVRTTQEEDIIKALSNESSSKILFHHRAATSLPNYRGATHPFYISDARFKYDYYILHNGVITNYEYLFDAYRKDGLKFLTEMAEGKFHEFVNTGEYYDIINEKTKVNDSEVFAVDLAMYVEGKQQWIKSAGTIAFIGLQVEKTAEKKGKVVSLIYGHNDGNPVELEEDKTIFALSSEAGGKEIEVDKIFIKDWETGAISSETARGLVYHGVSKNLSGKTGTHKTKAERRAERKAERGRKVFGRTGGEAEDVIDYGAPNDVDVDDPIEQAILKLTGGASLIESHPSFDWKDDFKRKETDREETEKSLAKVWGFLTPKQQAAASGEDFGDMELSLMDIGIDITAIENEIQMADIGRSEADAGMLRQLRDDLNDDLEAENDSLRELRAAQELLKQTANEKPFKLADSEEAKALVDAASEKYSERHRVRLSTAAELESHMEYNGGTF